MKKFGVANQTRNALKPVFIKELQRDFAQLELNRSRLELRLDRDSFMLPFIHKHSLAFYLPELLFYHSVYGRYVRNPEEKEETLHL